MSDSKNIEEDNYLYILTDSMNQLVMNILEENGFTSNPLGSGFFNKEVGINKKKTIARFTFYRDRFKIIFINSRMKNGKTYYPDSHKGHTVSLWFDEIANFFYKETKPQILTRTGDMREIAKTLKNENIQELITKLTKDLTQIIKYTRKKYGIGSKLCFGLLRNKQNEIEFYYQ